MQKKIIVLALAAAFSAPAFAADTTVYGVVDAVVANIQASGLKSDTAVAAGGLAGSRLGVKSTEDLTSGLKASIVLEYSLDNTDKDAGIGNARQEMLALSGDFGTVAAGFLQTTGYDFSRFDPTAGSLVSPLGNIGKASFLIGNQAGLKRAPKALAYISPDMGGVTVALNYSADTAGGLGNAGVADTSVAEKGTAYLASVNYVAGPVAAGLVYASNTAASTAAVAAVANSWDAGGAVVGYTKAVAAKTGAKTTEMAIGASYDLEVAKLFVTYQTNKVDTNSDSDTVMSFSVVAPAGPGKVAVSYAKATMAAQNAATVATPAGFDKNASGMTVAWLQDLSKTSTFYAAYSTMSQGTDTSSYSVAQNAVTPAKGTGSSMIALGLNKKF